MALSQTTHPVWLLLFAAFIFCLFVFSILVLIAPKKWLGILNPQFGLFLVVESKNRLPLLRGIAISISISAFALLGVICFLLMAGS